MDPLKEPTADQRSAAHDLFGMYNALRLEGFSEYQACTILGQMLGTLGAAGKKDES